MNVNQEALAKARQAILKLSYDGEDDALLIAITTYLTELNKTHVIVPRELDDLIAWPHIKGSSTAQRGRVWKNMLSEIDAREG